MAKKKTFFEESATNNNLTYWQYFNRLLELSVSMFEWKNLPDSIDRRFLELTLFSDGKALFFEDKDLIVNASDSGYLALQCTATAPFNVYRIPMRRRAYSVNGYQRELTDKDSVIIWNNYLHKNSYLDVLQFAKRLYNLDRIIDVNANAQKTPVLITCTEQQKLTMKNIYMQMDGNAPVIFGDKNLDLNTIKALKTDAPYVCDKLYQLKTQIWNEALTYLGISNTNVTKKERMISDEVIRNMGGVIASRYSRLESRREAAEQINRMFGLNIEVNYRDDFREADDEIMIEGMTGEKDKMSVLATDLNTTTPVKTMKGGGSR